MEKKKNEEQHSDELPTKEVVKLYSMLSDSDKQKQIGHDIVKALVSDILQAKLFSPSAAHLTEEQRDLPNDIRSSSVWVRVGTPVITHRRNTQVEERRDGELSKTLAKLVGHVTLSDEEIKIAKELGIL